MKNTIYHLANCTTCQRIIKDLDQYGVDFIKREIRTSPLTNQELTELKNLSGSYVSLLSKRATIYKELALNEKELSEDETKALILQYDTLLKRPVIIFNNEIYIGSDKKNIKTLTDKIQSL